MRSEDTSGHGSVCSVIASATRLKLAQAQVLYLVGNVHVTAVIDSLTIAFNDVESLVLGYCRGLSSRRFH